MPNQLVISAIGPNQTGIANQITALIANSGCNIVETKMKAMGDTFSLVLMAEGEWNAIAKLEHLLPQKAPSLGMTTMMQRTEKLHPTKALPYRIKIIALDNPGIVQETTQFFAKKNINIQEMSCNTYPSPQTGAQIISLKLTISLSADISLSDLRNQFNQFCAATNLDGSLNPLA